MPPAAATPTVESPTCPCGQETPDTAAHGDGRRVNLCQDGRPCFSPSSTPSPVCSSRPSSIGTTRMPTCGWSSSSSVTNCAFSSARASGRAGGLVIASCSPVSASPELALVLRQPPDPVALASRSRPALAGPVRPPPQARTPRSGRDPALVSLTPQAVLQHAPARPAPTGLDE